MNLVIYCLGYKAFKSISELEDKLIQNIDCLIIAQDKSILNDYSSDIEKFAIEKKIDYKFRNVDDAGVSAAFHIAIGWRWLINVAENEKLIVIHDSLLPQYRGFNPLVTALLNGDTEIGVTALFGTESYDKGDIIHQSVVSIEYPIKIKEAIALISNLYSDLLSKVVTTIVDGKQLQSVVQDEKLATYSLWRDEEDYIIDWNNSAEYLKRFVDAVSFPYKGASCHYEGKKIRIEEVTVMQDLNIANRTSGKLILKENGKPIIVCGKGLLKIDSAKYEDGTKVEFNNFRIRLK